MSKPYIEITINPDGSYSAEGFGFDGRACHVDLDKLKKLFGDENAKVTLKNPAPIATVKVGTATVGGKGGVR